MWQSILGPLARQLDGVGFDLVASQLGDFVAAGAGRIKSLTRRLLDPRQRPRLPR